MDSGIIVPMANFSNNLITWILRTPLHGLISSGMMVLTYTGRKSGREISLPVGYIELDDRLMNTSLRKRTWWRSLRGGAEVTLRLRGKTRTALAEAYDDAAEVRRGFLIYLQRMPRAARFFDVRVNPSGEPEEADLERLVEERVVVYYTLQAE